MKKALNDIGLIILISLGVICVIYWIKQVPTEVKHDEKQCVQMMMADSAGSPASKQDPVAWKKSIEEGCRNPQ